MESNHMGAQAARLSVLRSAYAAASVPLGSRDAREHRASGFTGGRSLRARFKARLGSIIRPRLGAASSESPAKPVRTGGGGGGREGVSLREEGGQRTTPPPRTSWLSTRNDLGSSAGALRVTLGRPLCATSLRRAAQFLPILGARGRSSGWS